MRYNRYVAWCCLSLFIPGLCFGDDEGKVLLANGESVSLPAGFETFSWPATFPGKNAIHGSSREQGTGFLYAVSLAQRSLSNNPMDVLALALGEDKIEVEDIGQPASPETATGKLLRIKGESAFANFLVSYERRKNNHGPTYLFFWGPPEAFYEASPEFWDAVSIWRAPPPPKTVMPFSFLVVAILFLLINVWALYVIFRDMAQLDEMAAD